ncbi:MAG: hypothetical protein HN509_17315 [Halobacteriovoraceae bacterium]|jgi:hypothetical protein|nr:hypothetical protein [Halobacteriovoraceae bacterium]MBT5094544.1 hypothetical protein [Halobacteriovoraceae bacterium]
MENLFNLTVWNLKRSPLFFLVVGALLVSFGSIPLIIQSNQQGQEADFYFLLINLGVGIVMSWLFVAVMLQAKAFRDKVELPIGKVFWEGVLDCPGFLLYMLLYGLSMMAGGLMLIFPGFYAAFAFIFVTVIVVLDGNRESYFSWSRKLVHSDPLKVIGAVFFYGLATVLIMLPSFFIPKGDFRLMVRIFLLIPDALVEIFFGVYLVHLYFDLRDKFISSTAADLKGED